MVGELSLGSMYLDNLIYRNQWTRSNCGFDLAKYAGTRITLYPHSSIDYIFWWDTDYGNFKEFETTVRHIHPALLLNTQNVVMVLSKETRGFYRPKKLFIPPSTVFGNTWAHQSTWADRGLVMFAVSCIDIKNPWVYPGMDLRGIINTDFYDFNTTASPQPSFTKVLGPGVGGGGNSWNPTWLWWNAVDTSNQNRATAWASGWPGWQNDIGPMQASQYQTVALGPFVVKEPGTQCQLTMTYRSFWKWGGDILTTPQQVCDPKTSIPKAVMGETPVDPTTFIKPDELNTHGELSDKRWRQIVEQPTKSTKPNTFLAKYEEPDTEEETEESYISDYTSAEEEGEGPSTEGPGVSGRGVDGGRLIQLLRIQQLLKKINKNKAMTI